MTIDYDVAVTAAEASSHSPHLLPEILFAVDIYYGTDLWNKHSLG